MPAKSHGAVLERMEDGQTVGFGGLSLEMEQTGNEEPAVVMTGDDGRFDFSGILPGRYDAVLTLPQAATCSPDAEDGEIRRSIDLEQGDTIDFGTVTLCQSASISGAVRVGRRRRRGDRRRRGSGFRHSRGAAQGEGRPYRGRGRDDDGRWRTLSV